MSQFIENFLARPRSHKIVFCLVTFGLVTFLFWEYFYSARSDELAKLEEKEQTLQSQIQSETRLVNNLEKYRREVATLRSLLDIALKKLPQQREIPNLLASVSTLAKDSGLDVRRFAPKEDEVREFYAVVPVDVEMRGTFHKVATFLDEISRLSRIVNVQNISIGDPRGYQDSNDVEVAVKGTITTFRYLEPQERIQNGSSDLDKKTEKAMKRKS